MYLVESANRSIKSNEKQKHKSIYLKINFLQKPQGEWVQALGDFWDRLG